MKRHPFTLLLPLTLLAAMVLMGQADRPAEPGAAPPPAATETPATPDPAPTDPRDADPIDLVNTKVAIIPIHGEINDLSAGFIARSLDEAKQQGATTIVFDIDTPGGLVSSALDISETIKRQSDVHTVAYVNPEAISAGALISLACNEIVVAERAKIGDCAPIMISPGGGMESIGETEREKIESYLLAEFRDSARANNYPEALCVAMVTLNDSPIYRIRSAAGELRYVFGDELYKYGLTEPRETRPAADDDDEGGAEARRAATTRRPAAGERVDGDWSIDREILGAKRLLTMLGAEALEYGFATRELRNLEELAWYFNTTQSQLIIFERNWSEELVEFLTSPLIQGILGIVVLMAFWSETQAPGLGVPAAIAVTALTIMLGAPYLAGLASLIDLVLIVVGVILIMAEIFVIPGFGVAGISGILLVMLGMVMAYVPSDPGPFYFPELPGTWAIFQRSLITLTLSFVISIVAIIVLARHMHTVPFFQRFMLQATVGQAVKSAEQAGDNATPGVSDFGVKVGDEGESLCELRPIGEAEFDGKIVDVQTHGEWVGKHRRLRVVEASGNRIVVEAV